MVGDARFELATSPSRTVRATKLRQSPNILSKAHVIVTKKRLQYFL